jgi:RES domain-containing protein
VIVAYRLCSSRYPPTSGKGAALHGGRWNNPGTEIIYAADSRSLAALEVLVHYAVLPRDFVITEIHIPDDAAVTIEEFYNVRMRDFWGNQLEQVLGPRVDFASLGRADLERTRSMGDFWAQMGTTVLSVPSVIIPEERNYVLNVTHSDFTRLEFLPSKPFRFDPRLKPSVAEQAPGKALIDIMDALRASLREPRRS